MVGLEAGAWKAAASRNAVSMVLDSVAGRILHESEGSVKTMPLPHRVHDGVGQRGAASFSKLPR
jgi:hypothetical protein